MMDETPEDSFDEASCSKGPEPQALTVGRMGDQTVIFVGNEKTSDIFLYSLRDGEAVVPRFESVYRGGRTDLSWAEAYRLREVGDITPEDLIFVPSDRSPNGRPLLLVGGTVSGTVSVYEVVDSGQTSTAVSRWKRDIFRQKRRISGLQFAMGGSQSTRKVTIEQGDMEGVVKVSASVVKRMRGEPEDEPSSTGAPPSDSEAGRSRDGIPRETLLPHEQKAVLHEALQERDRYWQDKLQTVEEKNAQLNQLTVEQFHKAAEEVEAKFIKQHYKPVCQDLQEAVMTCYIENPKQTLNCAQQTKAFTSCVENARLSMLQLKASS